MSESEAVANEALHEMQRFSHGEEARVRKRI